MTNPANPYTDEDIARLRTLMADTVPLSWIAEDIGRSVKSVQKKVADLGIPVKTEWSKVWPTIMLNPVLLQLHYEFSPGSRHTW